MSKSILQIWLLTALLVIDQQWYPNSNLFKSTWASTSLLCGNCNSQSNWYSQTISIGIAAVGLPGEGSSYETAQQNKSTGVGQGWYLLFFILLLSLVFVNWFAVKWWHRKYKSRIDERDNEVRTLELALAAKQGELALQQQLNTDLQSQREGFYSSICNELNNPLVTIKASVQSLIKETGSEAGQSAHAKRLVQNIIKLEHAIKQTLDLSKVDEHTEYAETTVHLSALTQVVCQQFQQKLEDKQVLLHCNIHNHFQVQGSEYELSLLLTNLLDNAAHYAPEDSDVYVCLKADGQRLKLSVADQGAGMDKEQLAQALRQQNRTQANSGKTHGLGLLMVNAIAQQHNATLDFKSEPGLGTIATVYFNSYQVEPQDALGSQHKPVCHAFFTHQQAPVIELDGPSGDSPKCLIVEGQADVQYYLSRCLNQYFSCRSVFDAATALEVTQDWQADVIVLESNLSDSTGFELLAELRKRFAGNAPNFILTSTQDSLKARLKALDLDVTAFLVKPFADELLLQTAIKLADKRLQKQDQSLVQDSVDFQPSRDAIFLAQLNTLITQNIGNCGFRFDDYFEQFALSKRQFYRRVSTLTRCTPKQYLIQKRLDYARHLLAEGVLLDNVAKRCGFKSAASFVKIYQAHFGEEIV